MTEVAGIALRWGLYVDLMLLFGLPAFALSVLREGERDAMLPLRTGLAALSMIGLLLSLAGIAVLAARMSGVPVTAVAYTSISLAVTGTAVGAAWLVRVAALVLTLVVATAAPARKAAVAAALGAVALATLAWDGHGAMDAGRLGLLHLAADIGHLLAAGTWVGALAALTTMLFWRTAKTDAAHLRLSRRALRAFAGVGSVAVVAIIATGLVNGWLLVGPSHVSALTASLYGRLMLLKLLLFGAMLGLAAINRFRLTPRLGECDLADTRSAVRALRLSLLSEASCAIVILGLVAWLGTLEPPVSAM